VREAHLGRKRAVPTYPVRLAKGWGAFLGCGAGSVMVCLFADALDSLVECRSNFDLGDVHFVPTGQLYAALHVLIRVAAH